MFKPLFASSAILVICSGFAFGQTKIEERLITERTSAITGPKSERLLYAARSLPAESLAVFLRGVFPPERQELTLSTELTSNTLLISCSEEVLTEVRRLLAEIDRPKRVLLFELLLVERELSDAAPQNQPPEREPAKANDEAKQQAGPTTRKFEAAGDSLAGPIDQILDRVRAAEDKGSLTVLNHFALSTLDGQQVMAQLGARVPIVTSTSITARGRANAIQLESLGTLVRLSPRLRPDDVVVADLHFEKSYVGAPDEGTATLLDEKGAAPDDGKSLPVYSLIVQQPIELTPGRMTQLLVSQARPVKGTRRAQHVLLLGVRPLDDHGRPK